MRVTYHLNMGNLTETAEEARWAESMGYDGVFTNEREHDSFFPLLLAATSTSNVSLQTRVAIAFPRSPMVVAYSSWDLQQFSGGRFRLGLGTQVKGHNERRFSVPWVSPSRRLREYVQSLHAIWDTWQDGKKLDYRGEFYNFSLMPPAFNPGPSPHPRPPVYISAVNPYNCRVAGEVCDGLALHPLTSAKYLEEVIMVNLAKGAEKAGRSVTDIKVSGSGFVATGPNKQKIEEQKDQLRQRIAFYASTRSYFPVLEIHGYQEVGERLHEMSLKGEWDRLPGLITDEILETYAVVGEYDEVAGKIRERSGGVLDEVSFDMELASPADTDALKSIIQALKE